MTVFFRIVVSAIVIVATFYFMYWVPLAMVHMPWGLAAIIAYATAMAAGWFAWTRTAALNASLTRSIGYWALVTGAIGFVGGFFGPMILAPGANQGPLLGILITGPAGVLIGAIGGLVHWLIQRRRSGTDATT